MVAPVDLLDRKLLFVTGKGGVGKTTIARRWPCWPPSEGKRPWSCEVDAKGNLADFFAAAPTALEPSEVQPNLFAMSMDTEESLKEYLRLQLKIPLVARIGPLARTLRLRGQRRPRGQGDPHRRQGRLGGRARSTTTSSWSTPSATGHVVGQLSAPQAIGELVQVGLVRDQTAWMIEILDDAATTGAVIVAAPEEMPVNETLELAERIRTETGSTSPPSSSTGSCPSCSPATRRRCSTALREPDTVAALEAAAGGPVAPILDAAELAVTLRRTRSVHLDRLREGLPAACRCSTCRTSSPAATASGPPASWPTPSPQELGY